MSYFADEPIKNPAPMFDYGTANPMIPQPLYTASAGGPAYLATDGYAMPPMHTMPSFQGMGGDALTDFLGGANPLTTPIGPRLTRTSEPAFASTRFRWESGWFWSAPFRSER
jgi:hypothetical protein